MGAGRSGIDPHRQGGPAPLPPPAPRPHRLGLSAAAGATAPQRLVLAGVSAVSALGRAIDSAVGDAGELHFSAGRPPADLAWRQIVRGTKLQWWANGAAEAPVGPAAITVDLHGEPRAGEGRVWHLVDTAGVPLLQAFQALPAVRDAARCFRGLLVPEVRRKESDKHQGQDAGVASLYLIERDATDPEGRILAAAHLSAAVSYRALLGALGRAAGLLLRRALRAPDGPGTPFVPEPPRRGGAAHLPGALAAGGVRWLRDRIGGDMYGIAVLRRPAASLLRDTVLSDLQWTTIAAKDGFIADPFFWPGRPGTILCEAYEHRTGRGRLASFDTAAGAGTPVLRDVLRTGQHLSYPFTWRDGSRTLCLPEMAAARRQVLFELREDGRMVPVCTIAEGVAMADPTPMQVGGLLWIAYADMDFGAYETLCLMFAERPEGPWTPHQHNPVKIDARSSRPGGTPFRVGHRLYRPAQDCSRTYGGAIAVNAVIECTPSSYAELTVAVLKPDRAGPFPDGAHTLVVEDDTVAVDGKRISYHPAIGFHKILRRLRPRASRRPK